MSKFSAGIITNKPWLYPR